MYSWIFLHVVNEWLFHSILLDDCETKILSQWFFSDFPLVNKNRKTKTKKTEYQWCKNLTFLFLSDNKNYSFFYCPSNRFKLEYLFFSLIFYQNRIEKIENLDCCKNLTFLALANNRIQSVENLICLKKLLFLDLAENRIKHVDVGKLSLLDYHVWLV